MAIEGGKVIITSVCLAAKEEDLRFSQATIYSGVQRSYLFPFSSQLLRFYPNYIEGVISKSNTATRSQQRNSQIHFAFGTLSLTFEHECY